MAVIDGQNIEFIKANKKQVFLDNCTLNGHNENAIAFLKDTKEIYLDGVIYGEHLIEIKHNDLYTLYKNSLLIPGQKYRITDYVTKVRDGYTFDSCEVRSAEHPFDIIVTAVSNNQFDPKASCCPTTRPGGDYFTKRRYGLVNVSRWQIWYDIEPEPTRYSWVSSGQTGVIYRMIDDLGNDLPYDFKNIQFKRYKFNGKILSDFESDTFTNHLMTEKAEANYLEVFTHITDPYIIPGDNLVELCDTDDFEWCYTFDYYGEDATVMDVTGKLEEWMRPSNNVFEQAIDHYAYYLPNIVWKVMLTGDSQDKIYSVHYNRIGTLCKHMTIGHHSSYHNIISESRSIVALYLTNNNMSRCNTLMLGGIYRTILYGCRINYLNGCRDTHIEYLTTSFISAYLENSNVRCAQSILMSPVNHKPVIYEIIDKTVSRLYPESNTCTYHDIILESHAQTSRIVTDHIINLKWGLHSMFLDILSGDEVQGLYNVEIADGINMTSGSLTDHGGLDVVKVNDITHVYKKYICYDRRQPGHYLTCITNKDFLNTDSTSSSSLTWKVFD